MRVLFLSCTVTSYGYMHTFLFRRAKLFIYQPAKAVTQIATIMATGTLNMAAVANQANLARRGFMKRQGTFKREQKVWVVAVDGSKLCTRALRLVGSLCKKENQDPIKVVTVKTSSTQVDKLFQDAEHELFSICGVPKALISYEALDMNESVAKTLRVCAEKDPKSILVMGSAGRGAENAAGAGSRAKGQAPMSKMAAEVRTPPLPSKHGLRERTCARESGQRLRLLLMRSTHDDGRPTPACVRGSASRGAPSLCSSSTARLTRQSTRRNARRLALATQKARR